MLYSDAIKTIAESLSRLADDLNKKGQYTELLASLTEIINSDIEAPKREKKERTPRETKSSLRYVGLDVVDADESSRPQYNRLAVYNGEDIVFELIVGRSLKWAFAETDNGFKVLGRVHLPVNKNALKSKLRKLAKKEMASSGYVAESFIESIEG